MQYSRGFSRHTHTWLGLKDWHHTICHDKGATRPLTPMQRWYMERFNELLNLLKAVDEGGKPMLDNMLVVYVGELYTPWNHVANPSVDFTVRQAGRRHAYRALPGLRHGRTTTTSSWSRWFTPWAFLASTRSATWAAKAPLPGVLG